MITIRKLLSLSESQRLRKISRLCRQWQQTVERGGVKALEFYRVYIGDVLRLLPKDISADQQLQEWCDGTVYSDPVIIRSIWVLGNRIEKYTGTEAADWDFDCPGVSGIRKQFPAAVYCEDLRSPFNLGSVFRTAWAFGFQNVYVSPDCPSPGHPRVKRSAMGADEHLTCLVSSLDEAIADFSRISGRPVTEDLLFCLETGGASIDTFSFPQPGMAVIGSEELGVHPGTLLRCGNRRVTIPLYGDKGSLNVGIAFGILAHRWTAAMDRSSF